MKTRIRVLKRISEYQFGVDIIPEDGEPIISRTGKLRQLKVDGRRYVGLNAKTTSIILYSPAGLRLFELTTRWRVEIKDPSLLISDLFSKHVANADPNIRPGDELVIVYDGNPIAVGKARISGRSMLGLDRGVAVKVREKITT